MTTTTAQDEKEMQQLAEKVAREEEAKRMAARAAGVDPTYKPAWYPSPISLPEGKSGKLQLRHKTIMGETPVIGWRQAYARGICPCSAKLPPEGLKIHVLEEKGKGTWMTDLPEELNQIAELLQFLRPRGRVCIGGLGLGILAKCVAQLVRVTDVVVVERNKDVIKLCQDKAAAYTVVNDDIVHYLKTHKQPFDFYLLDTWQGTNEMTYWGQVFPQRRIIRNRFGVRPKIWCWAEDIMWGQVLTALMHRCGHWHYEKLTNMPADEALWFLKNVGSKTWEKRYGDKIVTEPT